MSQLSLSALLAFVVLLSTEDLSRRKILGSEVSRKIAHILIGLVIASWPFLVNMKMVAILGLLFTLATLLVREFNLFTHSRRVDRPSWGEPFFGIGVTVAALLNPSKWVFAAAILHVAIADGVAALVGKKFGKHHYTIFSQIKSLEGTLAFVLASILITAWVLFVAPAGLSSTWQLLVVLPIVSGFVEGVAPYGLDNLLLPVVIVMILKLVLFMPAGPQGIDNNGYIHDFLESSSIYRLKPAGGKDRHQSQT